MRFPSGALREALHTSQNHEPTENTTHERYHIVLRTPVDHCALGVLRIIKYPHLLSHHERGTTETKLVSIGYGLTLLVSESHDGLVGGIGKRPGPGSGINWLRPVFDDLGL